MTELEPLLKNLNDNPCLYCGENKTSKNEKNDPPLDKSLLEILSAFLHIFSMATWSDKFLIFLAFLFTIAHGLCFLAFATILGSMTEPFVQQSIYGYGNETAGTNTNLTDGNTHMLTKPEFISEMKEYSIFLLLIAGAVFVVSFLQTSLWELSAENLCYHFRLKFASQVLRREIDWFKDHEAVPLCFTLTDSVQKVREGIGHKLSMVLQYATICGVQISFALLTNWKLTMIFLTISPLPVIFAKFLNFGKLLAKKGETEQELYAQASSRVSQILANIGMVFTWGKENYEIERYREALTKAANTAVNKYMVQSIGVGVFLVLLMGSYAIAFQHACGELEESAVAHLHACSCSNLQDHTVMLKDIYMVFFTVTIAVFSLGQILPWITTIASAQGSSVVLEEILNLPDPDIDASRVKRGDIDLSTFTGSLKFKDVTFSYPTAKSKIVLDDLTFEINPGSTVGIIGDWKSGKSTIVDLIFRFYDPLTGSISVDNVEIKNLELASYRKKVGVLAQSKVEFMDGTIMENICAGQEDISDDKIFSAAKLVGVHDTIYKWDKNYKTQVREIESNMPKSVKLLIATVRALVRDPVWLIYDDNLSDLPNFPEYVEKMKEARKELVTIYITHNTYDMKNMDIIHFLESGRIVESGTFDELMNLKGKFYQMYQEQHNAPQACTISKAGHKLIDDIVLRAQRDRKYPSFWKMLKITNYSLTDWSLWSFAALGCLLSGLVIPIFAIVYTDIFSCSAMAAFGKTSAGLFNDSTFWTYVLFGLAGMAGLGFWMRALFVKVAGEFMILRLRTLSLMSIMARPLYWFDSTENSPTKLSSKLADGVPVIKAALDNRFSIALSGLISISTATLLALILGWEFGIGLIICVLTILALVAYQIRFQRVSQSISHDLLEEANSRFKQAVEQIKTIQYLSREPAIKSIYRDLIHENRAYCWISCTKFAVMHALSEMLVYLVLGCAFWYGAFLIDVDAMEPVILFRVFLISAFCLITFEHTTSFIPDYSKAELAFTEIMDLIEQGDGSLELTRLTCDGNLPSAVLKRRTPGSKIKFDNVTYFLPHRASRPFMNDCSFEIPAGKTLAIAGPELNKTTFLNLIMQFYDIPDGRILIDDKSIHDMDFTDVRGNIGYVPKDSDLFEASISENILYGFRGTKADDFETKALVKQVVAKVGLERFVLKHPLKYDTIVDQSCIGLNDVVRKRIMFARALVRNPKILLIDEPTAGLTLKDEMEVMKLIKSVKGGRTCILTTSKQSLIKMSDLVGWFDPNERNMAQFGTNESLAGDVDPFSSYRFFMEHQPSVPENVGEVSRYTERVPGPLNVSGPPPQYVFPE